MGTPEIIIISILGFIITLAIFYAIIKSAVRSGTETLRQYTKIQTDLLSRIARKHGVTEEELKDAYSKQP